MEDPGNSINNNELFLAIDPGFVNLGWVLGEINKPAKEIEIVTASTDKIMETSSTNLIDYETVVKKWSNNNHFKLLPLKYISIEHGGFFGQQMNSFVGYKLAILETTLYWYFKTQFPKANVQMVPAATYKRRFNLSTGNHDKNKKLVVSMVKELWAKMFKGESTQSEITYKWHFGGSADLANHRCDAFMMLLYVVEQVIGSLDGVKIVDGYKSEK